MALTLHYPFTTNPSLTGHDSLGLASSTPDLSLTRATTATMVGADGYIREVLSGEPRFDGATFNHNLLKNSTVLSSWTATNLTLAKDATDPFGVASNAWTLTDDATSGIHAIRLTDNTIDVTKPRVLSLYVKAGTGRYLAVAAREINAINTQWNNVFDTTTGTWVVQGISTLSGWGATDLGDGWWRIYLIDSTNSVAYDDFSIGINSDGTLSGNSYSGSGDTMIVYGPAYHQLFESTPRDHVATTGTALTSLSGANNGLLSEEVRTNICLQSEDFSTTWTNGGTSGTINTDQTTAPDGSTTADQLIDSEETGTGTVGVFQDRTVSTSTTYTVSCFAKQDQEDFFMFELDLFTTPADNTRAYFDLANGVVGTKDAGFDASGIEDYGNGWYRVWASFTTDATDTSGRVWVRVAETDNSPNCTRDGTASIYVWGAQLEAGATPTSYIPTTTASVTRNADQITGDVTPLSISGGTFYTHANIPYEDATVTNILAELSDGSSSDRWILNQANFASRLQCLTIAPGNNGSINIAGHTAGTDFRLVSGFVTDDLDFYADGTAGTPDTTADLPTITTLSVGSRYDGAINQPNGLIKEIAYWDEKLDDTTLSGLSDASISIQSAGGGVLERKRRQHYRRQKLRAQGIRAREMWAGTYRGRRT